MEAKSYMMFNMSQITKDSKTLIQVKKKIAQLDGVQAVMAKRLIGLLEDNIRLLKSSNLLISKQIKNGK